MLKNTVTFLQVILVLAIVAFVIIEPHIAQAHLRSRYVTVAMEKARDVYQSLDRTGRVVARTLRPLGPALHRSLSVCAESISDQAGQILLAASSRYIGPYRLLDLSH